MQSSLADRANQKLAFKFFGPFRIIERIGSVAYRLELPASSSIHPVFHVSQLKKAVGGQHVVEKNLPPSIRWSIPERILQRRSVFKGAVPVRQGLIKWSQLPSSLSTWEDLDYLRQQFPRAAVWGHPGAQGRGDVRTEDQHAVPEEQVECAVPGSAGGRPARPRKRSVWVFGPQWENECVQLVSSACVSLIGV